MRLRPYWEIGFAMNYKAGAQAGASRCQRHHPAQTFRLVRFILELMMKMRRVIVNRDVLAVPQFNDGSDDWIIFPAFMKLFAFGRVGRLGGS